MIVQHPRGGDADQVVERCVGPFARRELADLYVDELRPMEFSAPERLSTRIVELESPPDAFGAPSPVGEIRAALGRRSARL